MAKNPHKTDPKLTQNTPNASQSDTIALKTAQIVRDIDPLSKGEMLNTGEAPPNMPGKSRKKMGRPTKYRPYYCTQIIAFFDRPHTYKSAITHTNKKGETWISYETKANPVPLMVDFAEYIGTYVSVLFEWNKKFSDFTKATTHAQDLQLRHLATVTGLGLYNANWSVFMAKNISKWRDKKDIEHSGALGLNLFVDKMLNNADTATQDRANVLSNRN